MIKLKDNFKTRSVPPATGGGVFEFPVECHPATGGGEIEVWNKLIICFVSYRSRSPPTGHCCWITWVLGGGIKSKKPTTCHINLAVWKSFFSFLCLKKFLYVNGHQYKQYDVMANPSHLCFFLNRQATSGWAANYRTTYFLTRFWAFAKNDHRKASSIFIPPPPVAGWHMGGGSFL